ncbi:MAG: oligosaccharide flippase family protein [Bacteroidota bacterium]
MQKKFLSNLSFLLVLNLLVKPFYILGIDAEVQERVGENEYGLYFAILNLSFVFNILNDFGITNFNNRNIAQNANRFAINFGKLTSSRAALCIFYAAVTFCAALFLGYESKEYYLLLFLVINQVIVSFILFLRSNLAGLHLFKKDSIISVLDRSLMILFCGILLWSGQFGGAFEIEWFVYLQTLSYFIALLVAFIFLRGRLEQLTFRFDWPYTIAILKQSMPYALLILLMSIYFRIDGVMLESLLDTPLEAGIYAKGYRFLDALYNFSFLFSVLLLPIFAKMISQNENVEKLTALSSKILLSGVLILCISAAYYSWDIMNWRYSENVLKASECFEIIILNGIANSVAYIFGTLLTAAGVLKKLNVIAICTVMINISLNFIFIPIYGALGAAWASLITLFVSSLFQAIIAARHFKMAFNAGLVARLLLLAGFVIALCQGFRLVEYNWFLEFVLIGVSGLLLSFVIRLFQVQEFIAIIQEEKQSTP